MIYECFNGPTQEGYVVKYKNNDHNEMIKKYKQGENENGQYYIDFLDNIYCIRRTYNNLRDQKPIRVKYISKEGEEDGEKTFPSMAKCASAVGITMKTISKNLDSDTAVKSYKTGCYYKFFLGDMPLASGASSL